MTIMTKQTLALIWVWQIAWEKCLPGTCSKILFKLLSGRIRNFLKIVLFNFIIWNFNWRLAKERQIKSMKLADDYSRKEGWTASRSCTNELFVHLLPLLRKPSIHLTGKSRSTWPKADLIRLTDRIKAGRTTKPYLSIRIWFSFVHVPCF